MVKRQKSRSPTDSRFDLLSTPTPDIAESFAASTTRDSPAEPLEMLLTPPTSVSVSNAPSEIDANKVLVETIADVDLPQESNKENDEHDSIRRKSVRNRNNVATYNDKYLSGHAVHTRKSYRKEGDKWSIALKDMDSLKRTVSGVTLVNDDADSPSKQLLAETSKALDTEEEETKPDVSESSMITRRRSVRASVSNMVSAVAASALGKRSRDAFEATKGRITRSTAPKPAKPAQQIGPVKKRMFPNLPMSESEEEFSEEEVETSDEEINKEEPEVKRPKKFWIAHGLYVGQGREDERSNKTKGRKSEPATQVERKYLPLPMFLGARLMESGREFKLPFDILNPLPKTEHPKDWRNITKNRFVGEASASWNKDKEEWNQCQCTADDGCSDGCLNRIMRYECSDGNCNVGAESCKNRSFAELKWRKEGKNFTRNPAKKESNMWGEGIEVMKTDSRGHGVRAMRSFEPGQIIVEYTGEIITQNEADRRMNNEYKEHSNYYMMTFHATLIIDGYKGSICRFVNHSCDPNCIVEKWTVDGQPRMALFAGSRPIDVGEEITYDYNFAPFSDESTQECRCGALNCRGVLGPKTSEKVASKASKALTTIASAIGGAKRKLLGDSVPGTPNKRRKVSPPTPSERNKLTKMDPRTQAAPAVEPASQQLAELQQLSRAMRAEKRSKEEKKSRSGRPLRERHSIHTFPVPADVKPKEVVPTKRRGHSLAASATIKSVIDSAKKKSSAIANRASVQRSALMKLPSSKTRTVSGTSSTSRLLNRKSQAGLRQSHLSFSGSALSLKRAPESPTNTLRQSGRVHKPSPKYLESTQASKSTRMSSLAPTTSSTQSQPIQTQKSRQTSRPTSRPTSRGVDTSAKSFWDISGSEDGDDQEMANETPEDSPGLRQSKRSHRPSPRMAEIIASGDNSIIKRPKSGLSTSLTASFRNVAEAATTNGTFRKARAMIGAGRNNEKAISKTMRKISGAL